MAWDQAAIKALYSQISSPFKQIGVFRSVIRHEPKAAPTVLPAVALWWVGIGPARGASGLDATSARVEFGCRLYTDNTKADDDTETQLMTITSLFMDVFTGSFTLDGQVMEIDLLGHYGSPLSAEAGYVDHDDHQFRVAQCAIPVIANGLWVQVP